MLWLLEKRLGVIKNSKNQQQKKYIYMNVCCWIEARKHTSRYIFWANCRRSRMGYSIIPIFVTQSLSQLCHAIFVTTSILYIVSISRADLDIKMYVWCMARVLSFLIRYFSKYYTLHRSDLAAWTAPLDLRLYIATRWLNKILCFKIKIFYYKT